MVVVDSPSDNDDVDCGIASGVKPRVGSGDMECIECWRWCWNGSKYQSRWCSSSSGRTIADETKWSGFKSPRDQLCLFPLSLCLEKLEELRGIMTVSNFLCLPPDIPIIRNIFYRPQTWAALFLARRVFPQAGLQSSYKASCDTNELNETLLSSLLTISLSNNVMKIPNYICHSDRYKLTRVEC